MDVKIWANDQQPNPVTMTGKVVHIWRLTPIAETDEVKLLNAIPPSLRVVSYRPFARLTPTDRSGNRKTFDELAIPRRGNFQRWGVLRMDVDNLGNLFQEGFGKKASMSRIASLSFSLRVFFEGWLPQLAKPQRDDQDGQEDLSDFIVHTVLRRG